MLLKYRLLLRTVLDSQVLFVSVSPQLEGSELTTHVSLFDLDPVFGSGILGLYTNLLIQRSAKMAPQILQHSSPSAGFLTTSFSILGLD